MKALEHFAGSTKIRFILTDIDDTLTSGGRLGSAAYEALWNLHDGGFHVIPITGRPAGWCEMIARIWPVDGVVGENGAFYFRYDGRKMKRQFSQTENKRNANRTRLETTRQEILASVPRSAVASDQFCRIADLAIDFCEDVRALSNADVKRIVSIFEDHGAQAKISSIHVNGWFGDHNKISMTKKFLGEEFGLSEQDMKDQCVFVGDSPNDEPMFEYFPLSFAVSNIKVFENDLQFLPTFVSAGEGGEGFAEIAGRFVS